MHFPVVTAFSVKEFCRRYNVSPATAYRLMKAGELAYRKAGRRRLIAVADAEAWWNSLPGPPGSAPSPCSNPNTPKRSGKQRATTCAKFNDTNFSNKGDFHD